MNTVLDRQEREFVLLSLLPVKVLSDFGKYTFPIRQWERIQKYKLIAKVFWFVERFLFKYEKWKTKRGNTVLVNTV